MPSLSQPQVYLTREGTELILNYGPKTHVTPSSRVLVVGGGVTGLTTAWALLDAGYAVTVVSEKWASLEDRITSQIAGALWEWPPAVCGKHTNLISLDNSKRWCMTTYRGLEKLIHTLPAQEHGVRMRMANFFFEQSIHKMSGQLEKMNEIAAVHDIQGFKHDPTLVKTHAVNQDAGVVDSYRHLAPVIDTDQYMGWLRSTVIAKGGKLITARINGDLLQQEDRLLAKYGAQAIVNATGLGAYETAADHSVVPLRGALVRVINDGKRFPIVKEALCVSHDDTHGAEAEDIVFIVPRNDRTLILGGLVQPHVHTLDLTIDSPEIIRMRDRCNKFVPGLENAELDPVPFVQGLRPFRDTNVRVDREQRLKSDGTHSRIIHSYGQGGSGFTLSFGCAADVLELLSELEKSPYLERASL
ncbi:nucleotide-binding domain-containing protein [Infundibulicybe gibba]|nr:nucleotide-binding domain-containing protein [Infundibulicybe gibba]